MRAALSALEKLLIRGEYRADNDVGDLDNVVICGPGQTVGVAESGRAEAAITFALHQNYPNPFNPSTWIAFGIPSQAGETEVRLEIFTTDGRRVRVLAQGKYAPGTHRVPWNGRDASGAAAPSGVYFYRVQAGEFTASHKLVLIK
jgi:flagellar hook assembly protein FlgD